MIVRFALAALETFLIGLDLRLIVFSYRLRHWDAVAAEASYIMFVGYAIWVDAINRHVGLTWGLGIRFVASVIGIAGLIGIVKHLNNKGAY